MAKQLPLVHPGEVLREEFLKPLGWSVSRLAGELKVPVQRINEVVRERRSVSADTALRLSKFLGTTPEFWMNELSRAIPPFTVGKRLRGEY